MTSRYEEGDSRAWFHACCSDSAVLSFSPDTDCFHIGLPLLEKNPKLLVSVQLKAHFDDSRFLLVNILLDALKHDPDFASIHADPLAWQHLRSGIQFIISSSTDSLVVYFRSHRSSFSSQSPYALSKNCIVIPPVSCQSIQTGCHISETQFGTK